MARRGRPPITVTIADGVRAELQRRVRAATSEQRAARRARIILARRVTRLNKLANSGLHGDPVRDEVRLLLMSLSVLAYELLSLQPPITDPNLAPHQDGFLKSIRQWFEADSDDE